MKKEPLIFSLGDAEAGIVIVVGRTQAGPGLTASDGICASLTPRSSQDLNGMTTHYSPSTVAVDKRRIRSAACFDMSQRPPSLYAPGSRPIRASRRIVSMFLRVILANSEMVRSAITIIISTKRL